MSRPTEVELAWLAGIVDGEGTIGIHRTNVKSQKHPYLRPHFQIANTDLRILEKARSIVTAITGRPNNLIVTNKKRPEGHKVGYRWYEFKDEDATIYSRCLQLNRRGEPQTQSADVIELKRSA